MKFNTKTIHGRQKHDPSTGAVMSPIYQTSTFAQANPGKHQDYEYSRIGNPTRDALENAFASLENGSHGFAFASGMAAIDCVLKTLNPGDHVITIDDLYGGTFRMFTRLFSKYNISFSFVDMTAISTLEKAITKDTKLIWIETPTNPLMKIYDIEKIAKIAKKNNILTAVDNTFATPYLQAPLDLGADIVMHSATKYLGGHSDVIMGALICKNEELAKELHFIQFAAGAIAGPQDCFLVLRGIKTLAVRMDRHCSNGRAIVEFLKNHPLVNKIYYPGLENHQGHEVAKKQMKDFGAMISFNFKSGSKADAFTFLENLKVITLAESLGGVESLVSHPATMSHASIPPEDRARIGITDDLIRLSIGIEDAQDLITDMKQSFDTI